MYLLAARGSVSRARFAAVLVPALAMFAGNAPALSQESSYYATRQWSGTNDGSMNLSSFVFRDLDRDGDYNLGDAVFVEVAVELSAPDGSHVMRRTNSSGYANFPASLTLEDGVITEAGLHMVRVVPPPGWEVTTGNAIQTIRVSELHGAPGDLVADALPDPVGLAPVLEIRGKLDPALHASIADIRATGPGGKVVSAAADGEGGYRIPVSPGAWIVRDGEGGEMTHDVDVGRLPVVMPLRWSGEEADHAGSVTVGFDDLLVSDAVVKVPNGYHGLGWRNWVTIHNRFSGAGYINSTISGEFVAYTSSGHPAAIHRDEPFDFVGGHFGLAWSNAEGETLRVRAWRGDELLHEDAFALSAYGSVYFAADYRQITWLEFATDHYWQAVADDLTFVTETSNGR